MRRNTSCTNLIWIEYRCRHKSDCSIFFLVGPVFGVLKPLNAGDIGGLALIKKPLFDGVEALCFPDLILYRIVHRGLKPIVWRTSGELRFCFEYCQHIIRIVLTRIDDLEPDDVTSLC